MSSALLEAPFDLGAFEAANALLVVMALYLLLWKRSPFGVQLLVGVWALTTVVYGAATGMSANLSLVDSFLAACVIITLLQAFFDVVSAFGFLSRHE
jgi:hypothetical protein